MTVPWQREPDGETLESRDAYFVIGKDAGSAGCERARLVLGGPGL